MAIGPVRLAGFFAARTAAPTVYMNPFGDSLVSWIADPTNTWFYVSLFCAAVVAASCIWLLHGAVSFAKTNAISFGLALIIAVLIALLLMEGKKYDPTQLEQNLFALMLLVAFLSTAGRLFAQKDDKEGTEKDRKK